MVDTSLASGSTDFAGGYSCPGAVYKSSVGGCCDQTTSQYNTQVDLIHSSNITEILKFLSNNFLYHLFFQRLLIQLSIMCLFNSIFTFTSKFDTLFLKNNIDTIRVLIANFNLQIWLPDQGDSACAGLTNNPSSYYFIYRFGYQFQVTLLVLDLLITLLLIILFIDLATRSR